MNEHSRPSPDRPPTGPGQAEAALCRAYIDIETTGFNPRHNRITVIGIYLEQAGEQKLVQLYDESLTAEHVLAAVAPVKKLYSYNGARFDLPFIAARLGVSLADRFVHCDLMHHCWRHNLRGGLKSVEQQLGIGRTTVGIDGYGAVMLWHQYRRNHNTEALRTLLQYNAEDITNLALVRRKLAVR